MPPSEYKLFGLSFRDWGFGLAMWVLIVIGALYVPVFGNAFDWVGGWTSRLRDWAVATLAAGAGALWSLQGVQELTARTTRVLLSPGVFVVDSLWADLLRRSYPQTQAGRNVLIILMIATSWIVWTTVIVRTLRLTGLWSPFRRRATQGRHWILMGLVRLRDTLEIVKNFGRQPTGAWASLLEVLSHRFIAGDIFLGRPKLMFGGMMRPIGLPTKKHMVTIAGTGSGKSTAALVPNLAVHDGSLLCIDPKGELAAITARRRGAGGPGIEGLGQSAFVVDPFRIVPGWRSSSYNVFDELARVATYDVDRPVSYAGKIAEALVQSLSDKDRYWDNAAKTFLRGLILQIFVHEPPERRTLLRLRELVMEGDRDAYQAALRSGAISKKDDLTPMDVLLENMSTSRGGPYGAVIAAAAGTLSEMPPNQRGSVLSMVQEHTAFLDAPEIQRISGASDFLLEDLKTRPTSVYLCLPLNAVSGKEGAWLRMFVLLFIDMMMRVAKAPNPPVLLAIDEFPSLGKLDGIEIVAPVLRSYGVRFWAVGQDIEQFKATYPKSWGGFIGGAEAVQFMGVTHPPTVAYIVERLGQHVVTRRAPGGQRHAQTRALLDADQVARLLEPSRHNQIIWRGNRRPMLLKTAPYHWYLPASHFSPDPSFRESWRTRFWRGLTLGSSDPDPAGPPPPPPSAPPPPPPSRWEEPPLRTADDSPPIPTRNDLSRVKSSLDTLRRPKEVPKEAPSEKRTPMEELDALIGLDSVKQEVKKIANLAKLRIARRKHGLPDLSFSLHLVFTGNPGTGKTTVARLIGAIYKDLGALPSGHCVETDRSMLVANFVGQTATRTRQKVDEAQGGVLFIDEAYALTAREHSTDFGPEAIEVVLKEMEDKRDQFAVIVAGYQREMKTFIQANPGLESRFKTTIHFPDYTGPEMLQILEAMCSDNGVRLSFDARVKAQAALEAMRARAGERFGNGRDVRNFFEACMILQAGRLAAKASIKKTDVTMLEAADIPGDAGPPVPPETEAGAGSWADELYRSIKDKG
jgi:type IV secretory pathway TraG/TraD family ATPase VirD4/Holliday junction resolvasome RuvABC ATP-dependent DNA helicase subunit